MQLQNDKILKTLQQIFKFADSSDSLGRKSSIYKAIPEKITFFGHFSLIAPLFLQKKSYFTACNTLIYSQK